MSVGRRVRVSRVPVGERPHRRPRDQAFHTRKAPLRRGGPLDFAPTARDFLGRFTSPDVLAFWDAQYPLLRNGLTVDEDKTFGAIRIKIGHTRHLSQDGFAPPSRAP